MFISLYKSHYSTQVFNELRIQEQSTYSYRSKKVLIFNEYCSKSSYCISMKALRVKVNNLLIKSCELNLYSLPHNNKIKLLT